MEELLEMLVSRDNIATAMVLVVVFFFMKYIKGRDEASRDMATSCHSSHEKVAEQFAEIAKEGNTLIGENTSVLREIKEKL